MIALRPRQLLVALFVLWMVVCVFVPLQPAMPAAGIDESWRFAMNEAVARHLRFGPEVAMTYGPYASIYTTEYAPATDGPMLVGSLMLALGYAASIVHLMGTTGKRWAVFAVLALGGLFILRDVLFFSYVLLVSLSIHKLAVADDGPVARRAPLRTIFIAFLAFTLGVLPLVKGTFLVLGGGALACCLAFELSRRRRVRAWIPSIAFCAGIVVFWLASGQRLVDLPGYLANLLPTISGYTDAMSTTGDPVEVICYVVGSVVLLVAILFDRSLPFASRYFLMALYGLYLLIAFKGGFVRHDGHVLMAGVCLVLGVVYLLLVSRTRVAMVALVVALATWVVIDAHNLRSSTASLLANLDRISSGAWTGFRARVDDPDRLRRQYDAALLAIRTATPLPTLDGTTDLYAFDQSVLVASGNAWSPRPTFQSYAAYSRSLIENNRQHLTGDRAPAHVLFRIDPIDQRLAALEDGASWPELLARYRPVRFSQNYLFLDRRSAGAEAALEAPGVAIAARLNERVSVPDLGGLVFAEVRIRKTLFGKLLSLLYKADPLTIELYSDASTHQTFRLVSTMSDSPFLVSPLINDTKDFLLLYGEADLLADRKTKAFVVTTPNHRSADWQEEITVVFRRMAPVPTDGVTSLLGLGRFGEKKEAPPALAPHCDGNIDNLNDKPPVPSSLSSRGIVKLNGWVTGSTTDAELPEATYVVLTDGAGSVRMLKADRVQRPDVASYLKKPALAGTGFNAEAQLTSFAGDYTLGIGIERDGVVALCPQFRIPLNIR